MATTRAPRFVIYTRVSTDEQGRSGLGLEAQAEACHAYVGQVGGEVAAEFSEIASGDDDSRPVLRRAIQQARRQRATLLVAKLDRLSRAVAMIAGLMRNGGVQLKVADAANASTLELHLRATIAEEERRMISERTRAALAAAKARGTKLGSARPGHWDGREDRRQAGVRKATAVAASVRRELNGPVWDELRPEVKELHANGKSMSAIAKDLNDRGVTTATGGRWFAQTVKRLLSR